MRRLSVAVLGLVLAVGSCELPKPPIPKLDSDADPGRRVLVAAGHTVGIRPAAKAGPSPAIVLDRARVFRPPDGSQFSGSPARSRS